MRHHLRTSPHASCWLAEETHRFGSNRVVGYARSIVRERVWCLTEFFILPGHQRQGIGGSLLARCLEDGDRAGADTRLILASHHPGADSLYIRKAGCFPRLPMLLLAGPLANIHAPIPSAPILESGTAESQDAWQESEQAERSATGTLRAEPIHLTAAILEELNRLDREIVGYARPEEHVRWAAEMHGASRLFRRVPTGDASAEQASEIVGYAYLGVHSSGPALSLDPADLPRIIAHTTALSRSLLRAEGNTEFLPPSEQYWAVAGANEIMLRWLLDCGWQIAFQYLFMSSRPLGRLDHYVCHNPLYVW